MGGCFSRKQSRVRHLAVENPYQLTGRTKIQTFHILKQGLIQRLYLQKMLAFSKDLSPDDFASLMSHLAYSKGTLFELFKCFQKQNHNQMSVLQLQNGLEALAYETDQEIYRLLFWIYSDDILKKSISQNAIKTVYLQNPDCFPKNAYDVQESKAEGIQQGFFSQIQFETRLKKNFLANQFRSRFLQKLIVQMETQIVIVYNEMDLDKDEGIQYLISVRWLASLALYLLAKYQIRLESKVQLQHSKPEEARLSVILANIPSNNIFASWIDYQETTLSLTGQFECKIGIDNRDLRGVLQGQLRNNICLGTDYILVNKTLYSLLYTLYGGGPEYRRLSRKGALDLNPVFLNQFLFQNFQVLDQTYRFCHYSKWDKFSEVQKQYRGTVFYFRQLGRPWKKLHHKGDKTLYEVGLTSNCFLISMDEVNQKFFLRVYANDETRQGSLQSPCYGDVFSFKSPVIPKKVSVIRIGKNQVLLRNFSLEGAREYSCPLEGIESVLSKCDSGTGMPGSQINGLISNGRTSHVNAVISCLFFQPILAMKFMIEGLETPVEKQLGLLVTSHLNGQLGHPKEIMGLLNIKSPITRQGDAYKVMTDLINRCVQEETPADRPKYLTNVLNGTIKKEAQCTSCSAIKQKTQTFRILSAPLKRNEQSILTVTLRKCGSNKRFQVKMSHLSTILDLEKEFQRVSKLKSLQYGLFHLEHNDVYRFLGLYQKDLTLKEIGVVPTTKIYAYLRSSKNYNTEPSCASYASVRLFGQETLCKVVSKENNLAMVEYQDSNGNLLKLNTEQSTLQQFPNANRRRFLWIKVLSRDHYDLGLISEPVMMHLPDWSVISQLESTLCRKLSKVGIKPDSFTLRYLDSQLKCVICHKHTKAVINQSSKYSIGIFCKNKCKVDLQTPILWFPGLTLALDWLCLDSFRRFNQISQDDQEQEEVSSVYNCLKAFFAIEYMQLHCVTCQKPTKHLSVTKIEKAPSLLIIRLERFVGTECHKVETSVKFDQDLQIKSFTCQGSSLAQFYQLCGILCHSGDVHNGRYYSYIKEQDCWFLVDDQISRPEELSRVESNSIYILIYQLVH